MSGFKNKLLPIAVALGLTGALAGGGYYFYQKQDGTLLPANKANNAQIAAYALGYRFGNGAKQEAPGVDVAAFQKGFSEGYHGKTSKYTEEESTKALMAFQQEVQTKRLEEATNAGKDNVAAEKAFLEKNKTKSGIVTTASGLQYEVLTAGTGASPKDSNTVKVHYEGRLLDGKVFDSSKDKGPIEFPVTGVIPGWTEGLQLMKVGAKYRFYIPSKLAYGETGAGEGLIPPSSMLIFDVELLEVK